MRIGIDFDNTIVSYDSLFHKVALDQSLIPEGVQPSKAAVRQYLVQAGKEERWTLMQGLVYGDRMEDASMYEGVIPFLIWARENGHECAIISHKTKYPYKGPEYDLHKAARNWIDQNLLLYGNPILNPSNIFFELTKEEKLSRIDVFGCDIFIDDLMEILFAEGFPENVGRILFDPDCHQEEQKKDLVICNHWQEMTSLLDNQ